MSLKINNKENKNATRYYIMNKITYIYLLIMLGIFPLFYMNNYINILYAKDLFFKVITVPFIIIGVSFMILEFFQKKKLNYSISNILAFFFAITVIIACYISPLGEKAFWERQGRYLSGFVLLLSVCIYFIISRYFSLYQGLLWTILITNTVQWMIVILQFWNLNPLGMYNNILDSQRTAFLGTIGNANFVSGYSSVIISLIMTFYYQSNTKNSKILYGALLSIGFYAAYATQSESWILGVLISIILLTWNATSTKEKLIKVRNIWFIFYITSVIFKSMIMISKSFHYNNEIIDNILNEKNMSKLIDWKVLIVEGIGLLICFIIIEKYKDNYSINMKKIIVVAILASTIITSKYIFPLNDSFGSSRGYIWRVTIEEFKKLPIQHKLFGYGPNSYWELVKINHENEMIQKYNQLFIDAHNEALQFLILTGVIGMGCYIGIQLSLLIKCIKKLKNKPELLPLIVTLSAYMAQGLVNNPQIFITPLLFILLGIMKKSVKNNSLD